MGFKIPSADDVRTTIVETAMTEYYELPSMDHQSMSSQMRKGLKTMAPTVEPVKGYRRGCAAPTVEPVKGEIRPGGPSHLDRMGRGSGRRLLLLMHGAFRRIGETKAPRLRPLRPNEALRIAYQRKIDNLIREMNELVEYWLKASYRANKPIMAMDDILPANALKRAIAKMKKRWLARFDKASVQLAEYFSLAAQDRNDKALAKILKDGGFSVKFQQTQAMKDIVSATIQQNISLIKSIRKST